MSARRTTPPPSTEKPAYANTTAGAKPGAAPAQPAFFKRRTIILSIGSAVVVAVGAYMGAVIKTDVQKKQAVQEFKREDPKEQIARMNSYIAELQREKDRIDAKIREVETGEVAVGRERKRGL